MDQSLLTAAVALLLLSGCSHKQPLQPIMVSSASADSYALRYPDRLAGETSRLVADKQTAIQQTQKLATRSSELKPGADPALLLLIVEQADAAGRGEGFAAANDEARGVREFWDEERGRVAGRVVGAAQKQLTEANCTQADVGGAIGYALKDGVDKQLEKRLRAQNEAQRTIELNKNALGSANLNTVQKLADDIALTSYLVNIALILDRNRIDRLLSERADVDATLTDALERERAFQSGARSAADKKASQDRAAELEKARVAISPALGNAENARRDLDPLIENARKEYQSALDALERGLRAQAAQAKR